MEHLGHFDLRITSISGSLLGEPQQCLGCKALRAACLRGLAREHGEKKRRVGFASTSELESCGNPKWKPVASFLVKKSFKFRTLEKVGVADGDRTHDNRNHNPGLYQLSYSHRKSRAIIGRISNSQHVMGSFCAMRVASSIALSSAPVPPAPRCSKY